MIYAFGEYELDTQLYELRRDVTPVALEPQVFTVLAYLVEQHDRVVTKNELIDHVWPERYISEAALTSRLMAARKAIGDNGQEQRYIKTVHGRGYRFAGGVRVAPESEIRETVPAPAEETQRVPTAADPSNDTQDIRFCKTSDGVRIAYATSGEGRPLVKVANWLSHLEYDWRSPLWRHWIAELSRDHTYVRYDERGCGLSERDVDDFSVEAWVCDLEAVLDAVGIERAPLLGISQGGPVAISYAVQHPERVSHLILYGAFVRGRSVRATTQAERDEHDAIATLMRTRWGRDEPSFRQMFAATFIPDATDEQKRWFNDISRVSATAHGAERFYRAFCTIDVTPLLPHVSVPTLVIHATNDQEIPIEEGLTIARGIPGARFVSLEGTNHILLDDEPAWPGFLAEVRKFLRTPDEARRDQSGVYTLLVTDVEDATSLTRRLGDRAARELLRQLEVEVRGLVSLHGGGDVKGLGDGVMAWFKAPARALECAVAIQRGAAGLADLRGIPLTRAHRAARTRGDRRARRSGWYRYDHYVEHHCSRTRRGDLDLGRDA